MSSREIIEKIKVHIASIPEVLFRNLRDRKPGAKPELIRSCTPAIDFLYESHRGAAYLALLSAIDYLESRSVRDIPRYIADKLWKGRTSSIRGQQLRQLSAPESTNRTRRAKGQEEHRTVLRVDQPHRTFNEGNGDPHSRDSAYNFQQDVLNDLEDSIPQDDREEHIWSLLRNGKPVTRIAREHGYPLGFVQRIERKLLERSRERLIRGEDMPVRFAKSRIKSYRSEPLGFSTSA